MASKVDSSRPTVSPWSPLEHSLFRALWIASVASNLGTWIQNVGAAWLMTSLSPTPFMVGLIQTAISLPVFLLALPAGALADVVNRRRLLLFTQGWMLLVATALAGLTWTGLMRPNLLLLLTFLLGLGVALNGPAWQAIVPELVPKKQLSAAVSLSSIAFNIARAVGPAIGGVLVAVSGPAATFAVNAASFVGVLWVLYRWKPAPQKSILKAERFWGALRAGVRYLRYAPLLKSVLIRAGLFISCASALWALLPLRARTELGLGASAYGVLLGCMGVGALLGATLLPKVQAKFSNDQITGVASLFFAIATLGLAYLAQFGLLCLALLLGGMAWLAILSSFNVAAIASAPPWVRSRALGVFMLVFHGGLAMGSAGWGHLASRTSIRTALMISALGLAVGVVAIRRYSLNLFDRVNLDPSMHWPDPIVLEPIDEDRGPVVVSIEYHIDPAKAREFIEAATKLRPVRLRDGALFWQLLTDLANPARRVEYFIMESWIEHLRQHERVTMADKELQDQVNAFHIGPEPPVTTHWVAEA